MKRVGPNSAAAVPKAAVPEAPIPEVATDNPSGTTLPSPTVPATQASPTPVVQQIPSPQPKATPEPRRSSRTNWGVPPLRLAEMLLAATEESGEDDPKTFKQAMKRSVGELSQEACKAKVDSLVENKVFTVVDRPSDKPVITSKWVFKRKKGIDGKVEKYKARIVAKGVPARGRC